MATYDVIVIGGGLSGAAFARRVAAGGRRVLVLERAAQVGGCIRTAHGPGDFWCELGAHTLYSSYGSLAALAEEAGLGAEILPRQKAPYRLLRGDALRPVGKEIGKLRVVLGLPRLLGGKKTGQTVASYWGAIVGEPNYRRVFSRLFAAVPSQPADDFPADMLFKRRRRRKDLPRSFTLRPGLGALPTALLAHPEITTRTGEAVASIARGAGGFEIQTAAGTEVAPRLALALPPDEAARLLATVAPDAARILGTMAVAALDSVAVTVRSEDAKWPRLAGAVPVEDDLFFSLVTRDVVPHAGGVRGFTFHFRPDLDPERRLDRIAAVLGVARERFLTVTQHATRLPSPRLGHAEKVAALDALLPGTGLYLCGNYFAGLSLEDCAQRAVTEAARLRQESARAAV